MPAPARERAAAGAASGQGCAGPGEPAVTPARVPADEDAAKGAASGEPGAASGPAVSAPARPSEEPRAATRPVPAELPPVRLELRGGSLTREPFRTADRERWRYDVPLGLQAARALEELHLRRAAGEERGYLVLWPERLTRDGEHRVTGYETRPLPVNVPLEQLLVPDALDPTARGGFHGYFLHRVALSLARLAADLERRDLLLGECPLRRLRVTPRAEVVLIGVDDLVASNDGRFGWRRVQHEREQKVVCAPPEVLGSRDQAERCTIEADRFLLAVVTFNLLMGQHPYRGLSSRTGEPTPVVDNVLNGDYVFAPRTEVKAVPAMRPAGALHPEVGERLVESLIRGHHQPGRRPSAADWERTLARALVDLENCPERPNHWYPVQASSCPYCRRVREGGDDAFPPTSEGAGRRPFQLDQLQLALKLDDAEALFRLTQADPDLSRDPQLRVDPSRLEQVAVRGRAIQSFFLVHDRHRSSAVRLLELWEQLQSASAGNGRSVAERLRALDRERARLGAVRSG